uniref:Uncharacterized protein n=1 Tax=Peronospora matthiolae TaxID=2874970 RepID=A0AAV1V1W1_9STRA
MLDHLLPLISRDFEYFDESDKENYGYIVRRRARPDSSRVPASVRTPPRPPRRTTCRTRDPSRMTSIRNLKRKRRDCDKKATDEEDNEDRRGVKKRKTECAVKDEEPAAPIQQEQLREQTPTVDQETGNKQKRGAVTETPKKKIQQKPKISAKKPAKKIKHSKTKNKQTKVTADAKAKEVVKKVVKGAPPKRMPLQDITHLYVNDHSRSCESARRSRFVAGLSTSVAIRFF